MKPFLWLEYIWKLIDNKFEFFLVLIFDASTLEWLSQQSLKHSTLLANSSEQLTVSFQSHLSDVIAWITWPSWSKNIGVIAQLLSLLVDWVVDYSTCSSWTFAAWVVSKTVLTLTYEQILLSSTWLTMF